MYGIKQSYYQERSGCKCIDNYLYEKRNSKGKVMRAINAIRPMKVLRAMNIVIVASVVRMLEQ